MGQNHEKGAGMRLNIAARAARWSAAHWKTATFGWIAFVVVAVVLGGAIGTKQLGEGDSPGESGRMSKILDEGFDRPAEESVLVQSDTLTTEDPEFVAAVEDIVARVSAVRSATNVRDPLEPANADYVSADGRSAIVTLDIRGPPEEAADKVAPLLSAIEQAKAAHTELFIGTLGDASADKEIADTIGKDLEQAGLLSLPVTIVVLIVVFGALVAAGIPLLLALTAVIVAYLS